MQTGSSADAHRDRGRLLIFATAATFVVAMLVLATIAFRPALSKADESPGRAILSSPIARGINDRAYDPVGLRDGVPEVSERRPAAAARAPWLPPAGAVEGSAGWVPIEVGFAAALAFALLAGAYLLGRRRSRSEVKALKAEMAQRAAAERERSRKEAFHRAHYNNTTDGIFVVKVEEDGRFTMADRNPAHVECFGTPGVEILGKELYEFMPADQAKWLTSFYEQCIETRGPIRYVILFGLGHRPRHWETALSPIFDETGKITHVIGAARDISDRIELEEKLHQAQNMEAIYRAHFDNTTDTIFAIKVEEDGRFTLVDRNRAHEERFGLGTPLGKDPHEFMPADLADEVTSFYRRCIEADAPIRYDMQVDLEKGRGFWETVLTPVHDDSGRITHVIGASRDITDRIELEEKLRQSQKMEALGQLTGGIAHDFNNLLTVVMGNLDLMSRAPESRRPMLIHNALQATERARELTQKLLAFGRRQSLKPETTDLRALIAGMDDMVMQALRGDIALEFELATDLWHVEVDRAQFQVALLNLAVNARDAMPRGGTLRITARNERDADAEVVAIAVSDTGHGMSREVLERAFEPFFTTKEVGRGTGLGLAQVYGFANQSGGTAEIESEVGRGTTVTLYLPRCHQTVPVRTSMADEVVDWNRSLRILLVEDNVQVAEVAGSILTEQGHEVTTAHSADDALEILETGRHFDFVFSDLVMPGERDGLDLARLIRAWWPTLPVLLATGYSEAGGRATQEGFTLLAKPYRAAALIATIERIAAQSARDLAHSGAE